MIKADPKLIEFLRKLASLMREYNVTIDVKDETRNWETMASGIDIDMHTPTGEEWNGHGLAEIDRTYITSLDIDEVAAVLDKPELVGQK